MTETRSVVSVRTPIKIRPTDRINEIVYRKMAPHMNFLHEEVDHLLDQVGAFVLDSDETETIVQYRGKFTPVNFRLIKEEN